VSRPGQAGHDDHSYGITEYLRFEEVPLATAQADKASKGGAIKITFRKG